MATQDERTWGALAHAIPLATSVLLGGLGWLAALVIWLAYRGRSRFVAFHALQELWLHLANFFVIVAVVAMFLTVVLIPLAVLLGLASLLAMVVLPIVAAVRAGNGEWYRMPVVGRLAG